MKSMRDGVAALRARRRARRECQRLRGKLHRSVDGFVAGWQAHPVPMLVSAAAVGFVLARMRVGGRLIKTFAHIATGPAWRLARQFIGALK